MNNYKIKDKTTGNITICKSFHEAWEHINEKYGEVLERNTTWRGHPKFELERIAKIYMRRGETHTHLAEVVGEDKLFWPETEKEEEMVYLKFHGGKNGERVPVLKGEFEAYYKEVEND